VKKNFSSPAGQKGVWVADGVGVWVGVTEKDAWAEYDGRAEGESVLDTCGDDVVDGKAL